MNQKYTVNKRTWIQLITAYLVVFAFSVVQAQQASQGNATVFSGGQITLFGSHSFIAGGTGTQIGIVKTDRTGANGIGIVNFGKDATHTGANNANHIDGYVGKYGTAAFNFPIGNGVKLRPAGISGINPSNPATAVFKAAYWFTNSASYPTANMGAGVSKVSNLEYWDVDGASAVNLTLTWDAASSIASLTSNTLANLTIVGWNSSTSKWEKIASNVDQTSVLGGASTLTSGSITSSSKVTPDSYTAYTLAASITSLPDLTPAQFFSNTQLAIGQSIDYVVAISNVGLSSTTGPVEFRISNYANATGLVMTPNPAASVEIDGDIFILNNSEFDFATTAIRYTLTSKTSPNITLAPSTTKFIGFKITRTGGALGSSNNTVTITNETGGGEKPTDNNTIANPITKN